MQTRTHGHAHTDTDTHTRTRARVGRMAQRTPACNDGDFSTSNPSFVFQRSSALGRDWWHRVSRARVPGHNVRFVLSRFNVAYGLVIQRLHFDCLLRIASATSLDCSTTSEKLSHTVRAARFAFTFLKNLFVRDLGLQRRILRSKMPTLLKLDKVLILLRYHKHTQNKSLVCIASRYPCLCALRQLAYLSLCISICLSVCLSHPISLPHAACRRTRTCISFSLPLYLSVCLSHPVSLPHAACRRTRTCRWDTDLVEEISSAIAAEARLVGIDLAFAPVINMWVDARFGRLQEGYSENPTLTAAYATAAVRGFQVSAGV
jgi:hypothetical protein